MEMGNLRYLVAGFGSIGRRHVRNLRKLDPSSHITVYRLHTPEDAQPLADGADACVHTLDEALKARPDAVLIAGPASSHVSLALAFARCGAHLFIEKPLSISLEEVDDLISLVEARSLVAMLGYCFRFHPAVQYLRAALADNQIGRLISLRAHVGMFLPDWRPSADYRTTVSAQQALGGGAVFELSHELDYAIWIAGEVVDVTARTAKISDLEIDVEDTAEIVLAFRTGALGSIHVNMVERTPTRWCHLIGTEGTLIWNCIDQTIRTYDANTKRWNNDMTIPCDWNDMYLAELGHFMECVRTGKQPLASLREGRRVLEVALAAKSSSKERRTIAL
jgi:predicted dehydrogenase